MITGTPFRCVPAPLHHWLCLTNIQAVKLWPVVWPCTMHLQQHKRASGHWRHSSRTSFFIVVHFTYEVAYLLPICGRFLGNLTSLHVVGHPADPKKALPCVIARNLSHCAWNSAQGSLQASPEINLVLYFTYSSRRTLKADWHKFWDTRSSPGRNQ